MIYNKQRALKNVLKVILLSLLVIGQKTTAGGCCSSFSNTVISETTVINQPLPTPPPPLILLSLTPPLIDYISSFLDPANPADAQSLQGLIVMNHQTFEYFDRYRRERARQAIITTRYPSLNGISIGHEPLSLIPNVNPHQALATSSLYAAVGHHSANLFLSYRNLEGDLQQWTVMMLHERRQSRINEEIGGGWSQSFTALELVNQNLLNRARLAVFNRTLTLTFNNNSQLVSESLRTNLFRGSRVIRYTNPGSYYPISFPLGHNPYIISINHGLQHQLIPYGNELRALLVRIQWLTARDSNQHPPIYRDSNSPFLPEPTP